MIEVKDSGIEWIGDIPKHWNIKKNKYNFTLDKAIVGKKSSTLQLLSLTKYGVKAIREEEQSGKVPTSFDTYQMVHKNDLIMCLFDLDVSAVFSGLSSFEGMISPAYKCFKCKQHLLPKYADYYYRTVFVDRKYKRYSKNVRYSLNADEFLALKMTVPPIEEQNKIADYLDEKCAEIDAISAEIQEQIDTLEEYKRSVITEAVTKGLNPNAEMKDSGVKWNPIIPSHWNTINPKALFKLRTQRANKDDEQLTASQKYGIISQKKFMEIENQKVVTVEKDFDILKHVEPNDFVISMRSFQGGLEYSEVRGCISSAYVMLIPVENKVYPPFYKWFFKSSKYINAIQSTSNLIRDGQAMRYANFVQVKLFDIPYKEQVEIAQFLNDKVSQIDNILFEKQKQLETLEEYKKTLIYEYVTGKKEVA